MLSFLFYRRGGGVVEDGLEMKDSGLGSLEVNMSLEEMHQYSRRGLSSE